MHISQLKRTYFRNISGAAAPIFAMTLMTILLIIATTLDIRRNSNEKSLMQSTADSAALSAYLYYSEHNKDVPLDELTKVAKAVVDAHVLKNPRRKVKDVSVIVEPNQLTVNIKATMKTSIMAIAGISEMEINASASTSAAAPQGVNIALVLDTSGSMTGARISELKTASTGFVDRLVLPGTEVYVSITSFNAYVNVGVENRNETWLRPQSTRVVPSLTCELNREATLASGCTNWFDLVRTEDGSWERRERWRCPRGGHPIRDCVEDGSLTYEWTGCVTSRRNQLSTTTTRFPTSRVLGLNWVNDCPAPITPLSNNPAHLKASIDALFAQGETYMATGLVWAYRTLSPGVPFPSPNPNGRNIMIFMSDGQNSRSAADYNHHQNDIEHANTRTAQVCENAKQDGIEIFTIDWDISDPTALEILQDCSSGVDKYHISTSTTQLEHTFREIEEKLSELRITE